jgi:hypothetical protein
MPNISDTLQRPETIELMRSKWQNSAWLHDEAAFGFAYEADLNEALDQIIASLGELPGCTTADLFEAWRSSVLQWPSDWGQCFQNFRDIATTVVMQRWRSEPQQLDLSRNDFETAQFPKTQTIWKTDDNAYAICLLGHLPAGKRLFGNDDISSDLPHNRRMFVALEGRGSAAFFKKFSERAITSLSGLLDCVGRLTLLWLGQPAIPLGHVVEFMSNDFRLVEVDKTSSEENVGSPTLLFVRDCLDALFTTLDGKKKDSIQRRIKNAVSLLIEAKRQRDSAIGLALSVSSIEALICKKGENVTQMFAENMAVLLEPELQFRSAAEKWCKGLYDRRSGVLHGSSIECERAAVRDAECAATAVLKAMIERRNAQRRVLGDDENPEILLSELKVAKYNVGHPMFVAETPVNRLWRKAPQRIDSTG